MRQVVLALSLLAVTGVAVQAEPEPVPGAPLTVRVRLRNDDFIQGYLRGRSADEVVVFTGDGRYRRVPVTDIQRFEVRSRTGTHAGRGALIGALVWSGLMAAASRGALDRIGVASWQSGAILAGSAGMGALVGSRVPRYGWRAEEAPGARSGSSAAPGLQFTLRF